MSTQARSARQRDTSPIHMSVDKGPIHKSQTRSTRQHHKIPIQTAQARSTRLLAHDRSTRQHAGHEFLDSGVKRGVDDGHRPTVDEHQQRDDLASDELRSCRHRTTVLTTQVKDDVRQVPWSSQNDEESENDHHHLDDLLMTLRRRHVTNCHLPPPQQNEFYFSGVVNLKSWEKRFAVFPQSRTNFRQRKYGY